VEAISVTISELATTKFSVMISKSTGTVRAYEFKLQLWRKPRC